MGTEPVWPPPSPPCTSTASTPHSSTFSACRLAPIDGTTSTPPSCSVLDERLLRRLGEARHLHAFVDEQPHPVVDVGGVGAEVHPERARRVGLHLGDRVAQLPEVHRGAGEDTERRLRRRSRCTRRGPATHPIPVCTIGTSIAGEIAEAGAQARVHQLTS